MNAQRNRMIRRTTLALTAALAAGTLAAPAAHAADFTFDHDDMTLVRTSASLSFGGVDWGQEIGSNVISGRVGGTLTFHGGLAGCARVVIRWKNASGGVIDTDTSPEVCSSSSLPSAPVNFSRTARSSSLRSMRAELQVRNLDTSYAAVASKTVVAGGN